MPNRQTIKIKDIKNRSYVHKSVKYVDYKTEQMKLFVRRVRKMHKKIGGDTMITDWVKDISEHMNRSPCDLLTSVGIPLEKSIKDNSSFGIVASVVRTFFLDDIMSIHNFLLRMQSAGVCRYDLGDRYEIGSAVAYMSILFDPMMYDPEVQAEI